ncbi:MAG: PLP-dependent transferase [Kiritimatiellia bacterium]
MSATPPIALKLPSVDASTPEREWIHSASVTGPYGITAAVKDFAEVLDWQEHRRELTQGYYRLIHPPQVRMFKRRLEAACPGYTAVLFVSGPMAEKEWRELCAVRGLKLNTQSHSELPESVEDAECHLLHLTQDDLTAGVALVKDPEQAAELHERNRRRGGSLSARTVCALLGEVAAGGDSECETACATSLCYMEKAEHCFFYPSGMGAVTAVLDVVLQPECPRMLVLGNVYRDTHLLLEEQAWAGREVHTDFLDTHDLDGLRQRIGNPQVAGVLVETITNPLIEIPDLPGIARICTEAGKPLLVDSTMAGPLNATPLDLRATVVIHSTSKYLSGGNTHGGGIVLTNHSDWAEQLATRQEQEQNRLSPLEFPALWEGIQTYPDRLFRFNRNGETLAELLRSHPAVETVHYGNQGRPEWLKGLASVVSCECRDPSIEKVGRFFDSPLPGVFKAPSLGSNQTLFCPYVLLAYYDKSDAYLRECNLSKTLFRFAAGCEEDFGPVLKGISDALDELLS